MREWLIQDPTNTNTFCFLIFFLTLHTSSKFVFKEITKSAWNNEKSAIFIYIYFLKTSWDQVETWLLVWSVFCWFFQFVYFKAYNTRETWSQCLSNGYLVKIDGFQWFKIDFPNFWKFWILAMFYHLWKFFLTKFVHNYRMTYEPLTHSRNTTSVTERMPYPIVKLVKLFFLFLNKIIYFGFQNWSGSLFIENKQLNSWILKMIVLNC